MPLIRSIRESLGRHRVASLGLGMMAVGMLLWGKLLLKDVPRTAIADEDERRAAQADNEKDQGAAALDVGQRPKSLHDTAGGHQ